ncbi:hypothetical protein Tco_0267338 [Tanacetum coccineum]
MGWSLRCRITAGRREEKQLLLSDMGFWRTTWCGGNRLGGAGGSPGTVRNLLSGVDLGLRCSDGWILYGVGGASECSNSRCRMGFGRMVSTNHIGSDTLYREDSLPSAMWTHRDIVVDSGGFGWVSGRVVFLIQAQDKAG